MNQVEIWKLRKCWYHHPKAQIDEGKVLLKSFEQPKTLTKTLLYTQIYPSISLCAYQLLQAQKNLTLFYAPNKSTVS